MPDIHCKRFAGRTNIKVRCLGSRLWARTWIGRSTQWTPLKCSASASARPTQCTTMFSSLKPSEPPSESGDACSICHFLYTVCMTNKNFFKNEKVQTLEIAQGVLSEFPKMVIKNSRDFQSDYRMKFLHREVSFFIGVIIFVPSFGILLSPKQKTYNYYFIMI